MKDIVRPKALQSRPAQRKKLLQQRASRVICRGGLKGLHQAYALRKTECGSRHAI